MSETATPTETAGEAKRPGQGATLWLTGLSGAGKTTIAYAVAERVDGNGRPIEILDGDDLRDHLSPGLGFSKEDRDAHVTRVGYLARLLARNGVLAVVPVIAPYEEVREAIRAEHEAEGTAYLQVYVSTSVEECARRDVKGLYAGHAAGTVQHLTGVDDPYEPPTDPHLTLDTAGIALEDSVDAVTHLLTTRGLA